MKTIYLSYSRVSSREQAQYGMSIEAQKDEHMEYARNHGISIDEFYTDDGYSAGGFKRPGFQRLLKRVSENTLVNGGYDYRFVLLIRYQNRLIRDISKKRALQCLFKKYNVEVVCMNGRWQGTPIDGGLETDIEMIFDENERARVSPRVISSYIKIAKNGCYPIGGYPPLGYKREKVGRSRKLVIDEQTKDFVIQLFEVLALNRYTIVQVVEYLRFNKAVGRVWNVKMLHKIIDNPIYYGRLKTRWFDSEDPDLHCDRSGWYSENAHTVPLISKELFQKTQDAIHYKKKKEYHTYPLKGKVKCILCGEWMSLASCYKKTRRGKSILYQYYQCKHCKQRLNQTYIMEEIIWRYPTFERKMLNPQEISKMKLKMKAKKRRNELLDQFYDDGVIDEKEYIEEARSLKKEISKLKKEIEDVQKKKSLDFKKLPAKLKKKIFEEVVEEVQVIPGAIYKGGEVIKVIFRDIRIKVPKSSKKK